MRGFFEGRRATREDLEGAGQSALGALGDRLLIGEAHVPGEIDPGVLGDFGDEGVDRRDSLRLGIDAGKMRLRHHGAPLRPWRP